VQWIAAILYHNILMWWYWYVGIYFSWKRDFCPALLSIQFTYLSSLNSQTLQQHMLIYYYFLSSSKRANAERSTAATNNGGAATNNGCWLVVTAKSVSSHHPRKAQPQESIFHLWSFFFLGTMSCHSIWDIVPFLRWLQVQSWSRSFVTKE
jgi:hypothetical protein